MTNYSYALVNNPTTMYQRWYNKTVKLGEITAMINARIEAIVYKGDKYWNYEEQLKLLEKYHYLTAIATKIMLSRN